ncbi:MAG: hypothetical protein K6E10_02550 [Eubacterium sp.]|nr:hypothetical protein [Eubacterium sp.]
MKRGLKVFTLVFVWVLIVSFFCVLVGPTIESKAATDIEVTSLEDFYDKLAQQINDRDLYKNYKVPNLSVRDDIVNMELSDFANHYNPDNPLVSGCYLNYYLDAIYFEYNNSSIKTKIKFPYNQGEMDKHFDKLKNLSERLKGKSDYDTVVNVHDYLIENFEYDYSTSMVNHTDIDGFRDGVMVCSGYGLAAYYLLNTNGVETRIITGYGGEGEGSANHLWNMVKLDGEWYNLDITWDDMGKGGKKYDYFLKSDKDFPRHIRIGDYSVNGESIRSAKKSYKHPFYIKNPNDIPTLFFGVFIAGLVIFVYVKKAKKKKEEESYKGLGYVVDDVYGDFDADQ